MNPVYLGWLRRFKPMNPNVKQVIASLDRIMYHQPPVEHAKTGPCPVCCAIEAAKQTLRDQAKRIKELEQTILDTISILRR